MILAKELPRVSGKAKKKQPQKTPKKLACHLQFPRGGAAGPRRGAAGEGGSRGRGRGRTWAGAFPVGLSGKAGQAEDWLVRVAAGAVSPACFLAPRCPVPVDSGLECESDRGGADAQGPGWEVGTRTAQSGSFTISGTGYGGQGAKAQGEERTRERAKRSEEGPCVWGQKPDVGGLRSWPQQGSPCIWRRRQRGCGWGWGFFTQRELVMVGILRGETREEGPLMTEAQAGDGAVPSGGSCCSETHSGGGEGAGRGGASVLHPDSLPVTSRPSSASAITQYELFPSLFYSCSRLVVSILTRKEYPAHTVVTV